MAGTIPFSNAVELELKFVRNEYLTLENPTVCIHESFDQGIGYTYKEITKITAKAVKKWTDLLVKNSGGSEYDWGIRVIEQPGTNNPMIRTGHYANCDTNILLRGAPPIGPHGEYAAGTAQHFSSFRIWHDITIYTWEYHIAEGKPNSTNTITYRAEIVNEEKLEEIILHEIGHSFGLKHTTWNGWESNYACDQRHADFSIMYVSVACKNITAEIQEIDYTALIYKYGTDGWNGYTNYDFKVLKINR